MAPCPFDHGADAPGVEGLTALVAVSGIFQSGAECSVAQAAGAPLGKKGDQPNGATSAQSVDVIATPVCSSLGVVMCTGFVITVAI
jgi:hypothetical protein